jgi:hypothetical protein
VYLHAYESVSAARASIARYIQFFTTHRPHSALDRRTHARCRVLRLAAARGGSLNPGSPLISTRKLSKSAGPLLWRAHRKGAAAKTRYQRATNAPSRDDSRRNDGRSTTEPSHDLSVSMDGSPVTRAGGGT